MILDIFVSSTGLRVWMADRDVVCLPSVLLPPMSCSEATFKSHVLCPPVRRPRQACHVRLATYVACKNAAYLRGVDSALLEGTAAGVVGAQVAILAPVTAEGAVDA